MSTFHLRSSLQNSRNLKIAQYDMVQRPGKNKTTTVAKLHIWRGCVAIDTKWIVRRGSLRKRYGICIIAIQAAQVVKDSYTQPSVKEYKWKDDCRGERSWGSENEWNLKLTFWKRLACQPPSPNRTSLFAQYRDLSVPWQLCNSHHRRLCIERATVGGSVCGLVKLQWFASVLSKRARLKD